MNVLISGSSGLVGSTLMPTLRDGGHRVTRLVRRKPESENEVRWDPSSGTIDKAGLAGCDAVVHLAGENIAQGRWTPQKKARIRDSRVDGTRVLSEALADLDNPPEVMVCASASGYYGDRGNELLREETAPGDTFLSRVCLEWEAAADPARRAGIRVVNLRFGIVLSAEEGALATTLPLFKLGVGGRIGNGRQYWSWVSIDDVVGTILHSLSTDTLEGPVNVSTPDPPTNNAYTKTLGKVLNRPTLAPLPAPAARIVLGEVADELLLASVRMEPVKLRKTGYEFRQPELEGAFRHLLGR